MKQTITLSLAAILGSMGVSCTNSSDRPEKPNILLILTDDLGWQDLKCYDIDEPSPYQTPNLDKFSKEAVMFWQAYSPAPTSAPSRGAIISGKYPARLQRTHVVGGKPVTPRGKQSTVTPWYSGRLPISEITLPELLKPQGYVSGHIGKWHIAVDHTAYPQPSDHGFDFSISDRGVNTAMSPNRLSEFATSNPDDRYKIDKNGYPTDPNNVNAIEFMDNNKDNPFFLYYCTWLVHSPIQTRSKDLLEKYVKILGAEFPTNPKGWPLEGQRNPYFCAMVEMMDYYVGQVFEYLKTTDDPRWPGHKLIDNTYIIFTSDNGGCIGKPGKETYTDNTPLDKGKIWIQEGGIRVPMMISGPGIQKGVQSNVVVSGVDIYPTILSWAGTKAEQGQILDGADLSKMLVKNPTDEKLVKKQDGSVREYLIHHFPHSRMHSSIIMNGYKLHHNFQPEHKSPLELYQLYDKDNKRVDIEEANNIVKNEPELAQKMNKILMDELSEMGASLPLYNPKSNVFQSRVSDFASIIDNAEQGNKAWVNYKNSKNYIVDAFITYMTKDTESVNEWFKAKAEIVSPSRVEVEIPEGTVAYYINLVDNENFWLATKKQIIK